MEDVKFNISMPYQPIYSLTGWDKPDEDWYYVDKNSHEHRWDGDSLPTLEHIAAETETVWCDDCQDYIENEISVAYYQCKLCGEVIEPKYVKDMGPLRLAGEPSYYVNDRCVTKEEYYRLFEEYVNAKCNSQI